MPFLPAISHYRSGDFSAWCRLHVGIEGRQGDRRRLTFVMSRKLVEELGWQGGERVLVSIGTGDDLGAFQLAKVDKARVGHKLIANCRAHGFRLCLTLPPEIHGIRPASFLDPMNLPAQLSFEIRDGALELRGPRPEAGELPSNITALRS